MNNTKNDLFFIVTVVFIVIFALLPVFGKASHSKESIAAPIVSPHKLSHDEQAMIRLSATEPLNMLAYKVHLNQKETVSTRIDYYRNGIKKETVLQGLEEIQSGTFLISFGQHLIHLGDKIQYEWFIAGKNGFTTATLPQDQSEQLVSVYLQIQKDKLLPKNNFVPIGVYVQNQNKTELRTYDIDEKNGLNAIIKENENVYVFSCRMK